MFDTLGKVSGILLTVYVLLKTVDTLIWNKQHPRPGAGFPAHIYYRFEPFGTWILFAEIVLFGLIPALMLLSRRGRANNVCLLAAALLACAGVALNRFVMTVQTLALPDTAVRYIPVLHA